MTTTTALIMLLPLPVIYWTVVCWCALRRRQEAGAGKGQPIDTPHPSGGKAPHPPASHRPRLLFPVATGLGLSVPKASDQRIRPFSRPRTPPTAAEGAEETNQPP